MECANRTPDDQLVIMRLYTLNRAGVISSIASALACRGVDVEHFTASSYKEADQKYGCFHIVLHSDIEYARVLKRILERLEVVKGVARHKKVEILRVITQQETRELGHILSKLVT